VLLSEAIKDIPPWSYLILIQFTVFVFLFTLVLKRDDDETHEDVDHEERDDDDVDDVVSRYNWPVVVNGAVIFVVGVDRRV